MSDFNKQKYDSEYAKKNYDRFIFNAPKGTKEPLNDYWKTKGYKSLNEYIASLIKADLEQALESVNEQTKAHADLALLNILKKEQQAKSMDYIIELDDGTTITIEKENRPE